MKFLPILLAALATVVVPTTAQTYSGYLAVFYNLTVKAGLRNDFYSIDILSNNTYGPYNNITDDSSKVVAYDHTTIHFQPTFAKIQADYNPRFGAVQTQHILGYAMDEHGQALLVSYDGADAIQTQNAFPHVTISSSNFGPYSAVYSNDIWARIASSGFVNITNDSFGKPATIQWNLTAIADPTLIVNGTYNFTLGEFTSNNIRYNNGFAKYNSTLVRVKLFEPALEGLQGIFCASSQWNFTTTVCNTAPIFAPTTPPSTAGPVNNSTNSSSSSSSSSSVVSNSTSSSSSSSSIVPSNVTSSSSSSTGATPSNVTSSSSSSTGATPSNVSSSTGTGSSASMITSSFAMVSTGIAAVIALLFL